MYRPSNDQQNYHSVYQNDLWKIYKNILPIQNYINVTLF